MTPEYRTFLAGKVPRAPATGIDRPVTLPNSLFEHQRHCVEFALKQGRVGIYLDTGLGKSAIELLYLAHAAEATNGMALHLVPLAVAWQMCREAARFGVDARVIREQSEARPGVNIVNYDRLHRIDPAAFGAVALDEASILKSFTGKTTRALIQAFASHRFKLAATATPAPNDHMELGQQAEFLGIMPSNEMLMRWFIADQTQMGRYRLKGHGERDFWDWMSSWSRMAESPADLGFDGARFVLPELRVVYHHAESDTPVTTDGLFADVVNATTMHSLKRQTTTARAAAAGLIASETAGPVMVWCDTDYEADALRRAIPEAIEVRGSHPADLKETRLQAFVDGETRVLISKPSLCGFGLNFQHCHTMVFVGRSFSYESWYQAVRRCWRFGQAQPVTAHVIVAEGEQQIGHVLLRKSDEHTRMKRAMSLAMQRATGRVARQITEYSPSHLGRLPSWLTAPRSAA